MTTIKKDLDLIDFFFSSPTYFSCLELFYPDFLEELKESEMEAIANGKKRKRGGRKIQVVENISGKLWGRGRRKDKARKKI